MQQQKPHSSTRPWASSCRPCCLLGNPTQEAGQDPAVMDKMTFISEHCHTGLLSQLWALPLIVSMAVVFSAPHTHVYSPASNMARPWIFSSHMAAFCCSLYLSAACISKGPCSLLPLHRGLSAELTLQSGRAPFPDLLGLQFFHESSGQG